MEKTLVLLKPDAVQRGLAGCIIARFEQKGIRLAALKMLTISQPLARRMYALHEGKDFYEPLVRFVTASPLVAMVLEGRDVVAVARRMMGPTFGPDAPPGTIRGDFGMSRRYNLVHGSDSAESAATEIALFFAPEEIQACNPPAEQWIYARSGDELI